MIKIVAKNYIKSDKLEVFLVLASQLVRDTRLYDEGCIRYELVQDIHNPLILTFFEEWDSQESLDKHMQAKHFKEAVPTFGDYVEKQGEVNLYKTLI